MFFSQQPQMPIMEETDKGQITRLIYSTTLAVFWRTGPYPEVASLFTVYLDELTWFRQFILLSLLGTLVSCIFIQQLNMTNFKLTCNWPRLFYWMLFPIQLLLHKYYCILIIKPGWTILIIFLSDCQVLLANFSFKYYMHSQKM